MIRSVTLGGKSHREFIMASLALIPLLSLIVVAAIIGLLMFLLLVDTGRRGRKLMAAANQLGLDYRPYAGISARIRDAHFLLIETGQFRHFRHLLEGTLQQQYVNLFDYSMVVPAGTSTQTILLLACPIPGMARFSISHDAWLQGDAFTESGHYPLQPLRPDQKPLLLRRWQILSDDPQSLWPVLVPEVCDWLLAHPHLHIEWSDGILLICRPHLLLEEDQLEAAVEHAAGFIRLLHTALHL